MVNPVKILLSATLITVKNVIAVSHTMCAYVGHKNLVDAGRPLGMGPLPCPCLTP